MYSIRPVAPTHAEQRMVREIGQGLWQHVVAGVASLAPDRDMPPQFFIVTDTGVDICTLPFRNDNEKLAMMDRARQMLAERGQAAVAAALVVSCYIRMLPLEQASADVVDFTTVPKQEAYMLHIETPRGVVVTYTALVQRHTTQPPRLAVPDVRWMDAAGTELHGELVGFFVPATALESTH